MADATDSIRASRTIGSLTARMAAQLSPSLGDDASREARELLAALDDMPRFWPTIDRDAPVDASTWDRGLAAAVRRAAGAPLQYAAGLASFRHLTLAVDQRVLIPRPETEQLVEIALSLTRDATDGAVVDVGTGSGAVALSLASEGRFGHVIGTDISSDALDVARANARRCAGALRARVDFRHGSLLAPVAEVALRAVVSNPPYISYHEASTLPAAVRDWEPSVALFSGDGGMATTGHLVREAAGRLAPGGLLAIEVDTRRAEQAVALIVAHGSYEDARVLEDLTGRDRFVVARRRRSAND